MPQGSRDRRERERTPMRRLSISRLSAIALVACALLPNEAIGQQKSLKEQLVGTWAYVSSTATMPDGSPLWGTDPKGLMILTADGRFSWQLFRSDRPKFASKNRMQGTPEENAADLRGSLAYFGTYSVDEPEKTITTLVEAGRSRSARRWRSTKIRRRRAVSGSRRCGGGLTERQAHRLR